MPRTSSPAWRHISRLPLPPLPRPLLPRRTKRRWRRWVRCRSFGPRRKRRDTEKRTSGGPHFTTGSPRSTVFWNMLKYIQWIPVSSWDHHTRDSTAESIWVYICVYIHNSWRFDYQSNLEINQRLSSWHGQYLWGLRVSVFELYILWTND